MSTFVTRSQRKKEETRTYQRAGPLPKGAEEDLEGTTKNNHPGVMGSCLCSCCLWTTPGAGVLSVSFAVVAIPIDFRIIVALGILLLLNLLDDVMVLEPVHTYI